MAKQRTWMERPNKEERGAKRALSSLLYMYQIPTQTSPRPPPPTAARRHARRSHARSNSPARHPNTASLPRRPLRAKASPEEVRDALIADDTAGHKRPDPRHRDQEEMATEASKFDVKGRAWRLPRGCSTMPVGGPRTCTRARTSRAVRVPGVFGRGSVAARLKNSRF